MNLYRLRSWFLKIICCVKWTVKASANKHKYTKEQVLQNTRDYINELNAAVEADRKAHGKKL